MQHITDITNMLVAHTRSLEVRPFLQPILHKVALYLQ